MLKVPRPSLTASRRYKVLLLGSAGAGKTAAVHHALRVTGSAAPTPTLGAELYLKEETFNNEKATLSIWDCSGADRYRPTLQQLYSAPRSAGGASSDNTEPVRGAILLYDMTDERSFEDMQYWYNEMLRCCPSAPLLVVGTKADMADALRVSAEDGARQASEWGAPHLTISARSGHNVDGMFTLLFALIKKAQQT